MTATAGDALAESGSSANAIALPSGSGIFTWRTPWAQALEQIRRAMAP